MSAISDYVASVNTAFDSIDGSLDTANTKLTGVVDDVAFIKEELAKINNSPGELTPADQASLTALIARTDGLVAKTSTFAEALKALDDATERPAAPPVP